MLWTIGVLLLVLYPLVPLTRYFGQEVAAGRTNTPMFQAVDAVVAARRPDEAVLLDRNLRDLKHEGGGTAFRSLRFLLAGVDIDDRSVESAVDYGRSMSRGSSALLVMDARSYGRLRGGCGAAARHRRRRPVSRGADRRRWLRHLSPGASWRRRVERPDRAAQLPGVRGVGFCA